MSVSELITQSRLTEKPTLRKYASFNIPLTCTTRQPQHNIQSWLNPIHVLTAYSSRAMQ